MNSNKLTWAASMLSLLTIVIVSGFLGTKQLLDVLEGYPSCFPPFTYVPAGKSQCPRTPTTTHTGRDEGLRSLDGLSPLNRTRVSESLP